MSDVVDHPADLRRVCAELDAELRADNRVAIDTEFVGEKSYEPQLMLVQLALPGGRIALIDAPALVRHLQPLAELLSAPGRLKVMHSGSQDVPILNAYLGDLPGPWFDTQIAAAYVGFPLQAGYTRLVESLLGVHLARDESRSDWSRRPIPRSMLAYAADDVRYLLDLHARLAAQLAQLGRAAWCAEDVAEMVRRVTERVHPSELWRKIARGAGLSGRGLAILRELSVWRDDEARRHDRPRRGVLKDETLIEFARRAPTTAAAVMTLRGLPTHVGERRAEEIAARVRAALEVPPSDRPVLDDTAPSLDDQGAALYELLSAVARIRATELDIAPSLLAPADPLRRLAASRRPDDVDRYFPGWRGELLGQTLRMTVAGELAVVWDADAGRLVSRPAR